MQNRATFANSNLHNHSFDSYKRLRKSFGTIFWGHAGTTIFNVGTNQHQHYMHTKTNIAQKFVPAKYTLKLGFAQVTRFPIFSPNHGVCPPYLGGGLIFMCPKFSQTAFGVRCSKKEMPR